MQERFHIFSWEKLMQLCEKHWVIIAPELPPEAKYIADARATAILKAQTKDGPWEASLDLVVSEKHNDCPACFAEWAWMHHVKNSTRKYIREMAPRG